MGAMGAMGNKPGMKRYKEGVSGSLSASGGTVKQMHHLKHLTTHSVEKASSQAGKKYKEGVSGSKPVWWESTHLVRR